jgi:ABC-type amino acid transport substrate-binding protein
VAGAAAEGAMLQQAGRLRVAVYNDFPPWSYDGKGIDVDIAKAVAAHLGLQTEIAWFNAGEDMNDDLRNMVWKGTLLGMMPGDVMMHVPVDAHLAKANDKVRIFAPYCEETLAVARDPSRIKPVSGSAAVALEVFTREKIGVETGALADSFLLGVLNGKLRDQVVHYRSVALAVAGMRAGEVSAVMAPRGELEAALGTETRYAIGAVNMPELHINRWALGMAVKAGNAPLEQALSGALTDLHRDGTIKGIFARYGVTRQVTGE